MHVCGQAETLGGIVHSTVLMAHCLHIIFATDAAERDMQVTNINLSVLRTRDVAECCVVARSHASSAHVDAAPRHLFLEPTAQAQ